MRIRVRGGRAVRCSLALVLFAVLALSDLASAAPQAEPGVGPSVAQPVAAFSISGGEDVRTTEAEALVAAKEQGRPVEVGAFRGERRETYANPDGTLTAREHLQPVRIAKNGQWVPVDTSLTRLSDGSITPKAAAIDLQLSGGGDGPLIEASRAGRHMSLGWPGRLPAPVLDGARATYPEVLPGVDLVINVTTTGFSHVLAIKNSEAARDPRLDAVQFTLDTKDLDVRSTGEGGVAAIDRVTNGAVFETGEPVMWDAGRAVLSGGNYSPDALKSAPESARVRRIRVEVGGGKLTLRPDRAMLTDPTTHWPVYLDPVWEATSNSAWAMIDSGYGNDRYWKFNGSPDERVGMCPVPEGTCGANSRVKRLFYVLPTPYVGREIISAEFRVTMIHTYDTSARGVSLYRTGGISSGTTWNNQPGGVGWSGAVLQQSISPTAKQSSCTATNQNVGFNATAGVREAAAYGWSATTFGIKADNESDYHWLKRFCSNAILSVNFNRAPDRPSASELTMSPGGGCVSGSGRPFVDAPPQLYAVLRDPDHSPAHAEQVSGQFRVFWPADAPTVSRTYDTVLKVSGSTFSITAPSDMPENVPIGWEVRASDGRAWSAWSSAGQTRCEFVFDKTQPTAPDIDSPEYLPGDANETTYVCAGDDAVWRGSIGAYGTFIFDSAATDVHEYWYGFNENPSPVHKLSPSTLGGAVSMRWMPERDGLNFVTVQAVDQANKKSVIAICHFRVATAPPVADWSLGDPAGSTTAADGSGQSPASAGPGVTFNVPGPGGLADPAVRLTGAADSYLVTQSRGVADTGAGFSVSAWVYLADVTRDATAVSQSGAGEPGFTLGFDAASGQWEFELPSTDFNGLGSWRVLGPAVKDKWNHLVAVYDAEQRVISLYVNGGTPTHAQRRSQWRARGPVQLGRKQTKWGYSEPWNGGLADVLLFNRVVVDREVAELGELVPARRAYWPLNEAAEGRTPEYTGGIELALTGGASLYRFDPEVDPFGEPALVGAGHLVLDGVDDYAAADSAVAVTDASFTVSARVRLTSNGCGRDMAVVSQPGTQTSAFVVRCSAANRWQVVLAQADSANAAEDTATDNQVLPEATSAGTHLAVVYNALTNEVRLYVDGQLADSARTQHTEAWHAAGGFQVGRALSGGAWSQYFAGVVDDVRVYEGVADASTIQRLALLTEQPDL